MARRGLLRMLSGQLLVVIALGAQDVLPDQELHSFVSSVLRYNVNLDSKIADLAFRGSELPTNNPTISKAS